ncbi:MAG: PD-(D/E)XK nuclease family protein [Deltaproteobacteria bacterium]|nr:PD-(D/E)XK nuclease family protein [Deltaproteobacteria bacterium]
MESENLDMGRKVVEAYRKAFPIKEFDAVKQVVKIFKEKYLERFRKELEKEKLEEKEQFNKAVDLLKSFKSRGIYKKAISYDLFCILRINVLENDISDVVASVIDPSKTPFGKDILMKIAKHAILKDPKNINGIYKIIKDTPENRFVCKREYAGESSRIDIRIFTRNSDIEKNVVIDFEMKTEGGSETKKDGKFQTKREYKALENFAKSKKIPPKNILAFFVTPYGSNPMSEKFIPLAMDELRDIILNILMDKKETELNNFDGCAIGAICHFFRSGYIF